MAEKGTLRASLVGGESIATRDAFDLDGDSNPRVIQRFDIANVRFPSPMGTAIRTSVAAVDPIEETNFPAEITANLIDCGDKTKLVIWAEGSGNDISTIDIIPLVYTAEVTPVLVGSLIEKRLNLSGTIIHRVNGGNGALTSMISWDLLGAPKIGIWVETYSVTGTMDIWGYVY